MNNKNTKILGEALWLARFYGGELTQKQLAKKAGVQQPTISYIENGTRSYSLPYIERLIKLCGGKLELQYRLETADGGVCS